MAAEQGGAAAAPEPPAATAGAASESSPGRIEESRPSVYYLPDKQGNLQPVLQFKYQDFVDLYKLKNQLEQRDQPPSYSIQRMIVTGTAGAEHSELTIKCQILFLATKTGSESPCGWTRDCCAERRSTKEAGSNSCTLREKAPVMFAGSAANLIRNTKSP